jgi:hypothetical protein
MTIPRGRGRLAGAWCLIVLASAASLVLSDEPQLDHAHYEPGVAHRSLLQTSTQCTASNAVPNCLTCVRRQVSVAGSLVWQSSCTTCNAGFRRILSGAACGESLVKQPHDTLLAGLSTPLAPDTLPPIPSSTTMHIYTGTSAVSHHHAEDIQLACCVVPAP